MQATQNKKTTQNNLFEKVFKLSEHDTNVRTELIAGVTTFMTMAYILAVNSNMLSQAGMDAGAVFVATALSAAISNLLPFIIFNVKRFFENEFSTSKYPYMTKDGKIEYITVKDPSLAFSDEVIKHEAERFIKGYSNRFIPIEVPNEEGKLIYMKFKGRNVSSYGTKEDIESDKTGIINRRLTWCDVFYIAAIESSKGKHALLTRYPLNDYFGQIPNKINVMSTIKTEKVILDGQLYEYYPLIREEDIGSDTSNIFIDTLQISNLYLKGLEGDFKIINSIGVFFNKNLLNCWKLLRAK